MSPIDEKPIDYSEYLYTNEFKGTQTVNIKDAKGEAAYLGGKITTLLREFEEKTGVTVEALTIERKERHTRRANEIRYVQLEVKL